MQFLNNHSIWCEAGSCFNTKDAILRFFSDKFAKILKCQSDDLFEALFNRESLQTTAQKNGIALPHCLIDKVDGVYAGFLKLDNPVYFDTLQQHECDLFICIIASQNGGADYLKFLAKVSRFMRDTEIQSGLRKADTIDTIFKILSPIIL